MSYVVQGHVDHHLNKLPIGSAFYHDYHADNLTEQVVGEDAGVLVVWDISKILGSVQA